MLMSALPSEARVRAGGSMLRAAALALIFGLLVVVFLAPADAATTSAIPGGLVLTTHQAPQANSLGTRWTSQQHGISWAARAPKRVIALVASALVSLAVAVACAVALRPRFRVPDAFDAPRLRWFGPTSAIRGPPASLARP